MKQIKAAFGQTAIINPKKFVSTKEELSDNEIHRSRSLNVKKLKLKQKADLD